MTAPNETAMNATELTVKQKKQEYTEHRVKMVFLI